MRAFVCLGLGSILLLASPVSAAPVAVGLGSFSGSATVIDFNGIPNQTVIANQYSGSGITFGATPLFANSFPSTASLLAGSGGFVASNFVSPSSPPCPGSCFGSITIDLASTALRIGFQTYTADPQLTLTVFAGDPLVPTGSLVVTTGTTDTFVGIEDTAGIDRLVLTGKGPFTDTIVIDNLRFDPIPEPSTGLLLAAGLLVTASTSRRARRTAA